MSIQQICTSDPVSLDLALIKERYEWECALRSSTVVQRVLQEIQTVGVRAFYQQPSLTLALSSYIPLYLDVDPRLESFLRVLVGIFIGTLYEGNAYPGWRECRTEYFCQTVTRGNNRDALEVLENPLMLNSRDNSYHIYPFLLACQFGSEQLALKLLLQGADPSMGCTEKGDMALHLAARKGWVVLSTELLNKGANVNAVNPRGETPLHLATACQNVEALALLIRAGADIDRLDSEGFSPLMRAAQNKDIEAQRILLLHGADPRLRSPSGYSALDADLYVLFFRLCRMDDVELTQKLIHYGIPPSFRDQIGLTPRSAAYWMNSQRVFSQLGGVLDGFERAFMRRKVVAHALGLKGDSSYAGIEFELLGGHSPHFSKWIRLALDAFPASALVKKEQLEEIQRAYLRAETSKPFPEFLAGLQTEPLSFLFTGSIAHAIALIFIEIQGEQYLGISNRGDGVYSKKKTFSFFPIEKSKLTVEILEKMWRLRHFETKWEVCQQFYYTTLPALLSPPTLVDPKSITLCNQIASIGCSLQKVGNCSFSCLIALMRAAFIRYALLNTGSKTFTVKLRKEIVAESKRFSTYLKQIMAVWFLKHEGEEPADLRDTALMTRVENKMRQRLEKQSVQSSMETKDV